VVKSVRVDKRLPASSCVLQIAAPNRKKVPQLSPSRWYRSAPRVGHSSGVPNWFITNNFCSLNQLRQADTHLCPTTVGTYQLKVAAIRANFRAVLNARPIFGHASVAAHRVKRSNECPIAVGAEQRIRFIAHACHDYSYVDSHDGAKVAWKSEATRY
jgi:hypothetical protein